MNYAGICWVYLIHVNIDVTNLFAMFINMFTNIIQYKIIIFITLIIIFFLIQTISHCIVSKSAYFSASPPLIMSEMMMGSPGLSVPEMVIPRGPPLRWSSTVYTTDSSQLSSKGRKRTLINASLQYYNRGNNKKTTIDIITTNGEELE